MQEYLVQVEKDPKYFDLYDVTRINEAWPKGFLIAVMVNKTTARDYWGEYVKLKPATRKEWLRHLRRIRPEYFISESWRARKKQKDDVKISA